MMNEMLTEARANNKNVDLDSPEAVAKALKEAQKLKQAGNAGISEEDRKAAAMAGTILGWSTSKVYRKLKAYEAAGHALALAEERPKRVWHSKLSPEQDEILETALTRFTSLQKYRGQPVSEFVKLVFAKCDDAGIPRPSESSVRRRWRRLSERVRYAHKHGRRAAADPRPPSPSSRHPSDHSTVWSQQ